MSDDDIRRHLADYAVAQKNPNWEKVSSDDFADGCEVFFTNAGQERTWICCSCEVPVPYSFFKLAKRPEFVNAHPELSDQLLQFELVEHLAPGDCLMKMSFKAAKTDAMASMLLGNGGSGTGQNIRISQHDNTPVVGETTVVMVGMGVDWLNFANAAFMSVIMNYSKGIDENSTRLRYTYRCAWQTYPEWFNKVACMFFEMTMKKGELFTAEMPRLLPIAEQFYKIICLRGCCRGPPLLPQEEWSEGATSEKLGGFYWSAADDSTFTFSTYMQKLMRICGSDARVFCTMSGQRLVPYQAAVLADEFEKVETRFRELFSAQCSAYRFLRGGSGAPKLRADIEARFVPESISLPEPTKLSIDDFLIFKVEQNTFVDFQCAQDSFVVPSIHRKAAEYP
eukprot:TRINITY_DN27824_c0_g1_i1.p1 TRINITY_DN27824_c0_g1~~TRINITY_DN27824_c0_g1_i1.p1  ORF type:complete len:395 (-),score=83.77 TRINITY_DN27824_c0_g1_i1:281-1465(-)